jgi:hypothetical protein
MAAFWDATPLVWYKFTDVSEVLTSSNMRAITILIMEAVSTSEMSVNFYQTIQRYITEDGNLNRIELIALRPTPTLITTHLSLPSICGDSSRIHVDCKSYILGLYTNPFVRSSQVLSIFRTIIHSFISL